MRTADKRFWAKVHPRGMESCWEWEGSKERDGYGYFKASRHIGEPAVRISAHRFSFELANGAIPSGMLVLHKCDNRPCVNPHHLFLGTHRDNMADMVRKGRSASGARNGMRIHPERLHLTRGERNGRSKLTDESVLEVRRRLTAGESNGELARAFGVSSAAISFIAQRRTWAHLD